MTTADLLRANLAAFRVERRQLVARRARLIHGWTVAACSAPQPGVIADFERQVARVDARIAAIEAAALDLLPADNERETAGGR